MNTELPPKTPPHWSGVTFITASEKLANMWIRRGASPVILFICCIDRPQLLRDFCYRPSVRSKAVDHCRQLPIWTTRCSESGRDQ